MNFSLMNKDCEQYIILWNSEKGGSNYLMGSEE